MSEESTPGVRLRDKNLVVSVMVRWLGIKAYIALTRLSSTTPQVADNMPTRGTKRTNHRSAHALEHVIGQWDGGQTSASDGDGPVINVVIGSSLPLAKLLAHQMMTPSSWDSAIGGQAQSVFGKF